LFHPIFASELKLYSLSSISIRKFRKVIKRGKESDKQQKEGVSEDEKSPTEAAPQEAAEEVTTLLSCLTGCVCFGFLAGV